jgi:hypothetical protein
VGAAVGLTPGAGQQETPAIGSRSPGRSEHDIFTGPESLSGRSSAPAIASMPLPVTGALTQVANRRDGVAAARCFLADLAIANQTSFFEPRRRLTSQYTPYPIASTGNPAPKTGPGAPLNLLWPGAFSQLPFPLHADTETGNISAPHRAAARTKSIAAFILHPHLPPKRYCARTASCEIYLSFYVKRHGVRRHHHSPGSPNRNSLERPSPV